MDSKVRGVTESSANMDSINWYQEPVILRRQDRRMPRGRPQTMEGRVRQWERSDRRIDRIEHFLGLLERLPPLTPTPPVVPQATRVANDGARGGDVNAPATLLNVTQPFDNEKPVAKKAAPATKDAPAKKKEESSEDDDSSEKYIEKYRVDSDRCREDVKASVRASLGLHQASKRKMLPTSGSASKRSKLKMKGKVDDTDSDSDDEDEKSVVLDDVSLAVKMKDDEHLEETCKGGTKRKKSTTGDQMPKVPKAERNVSLSRSAAGKNATALGNESPRASDLESKLETQSKELWAVKDDLRKHVTAAKLRKMLEANGQDVAGSELDLRDCCADGMLFGALCCCTVCSGHLRYSGGEYRCLGYLSEWTYRKCLLPAPPWSSCLLGLRAF